MSSFVSNEIEVYSPTSLLVSTAEILQVPFELLLAYFKSPFVISKYEM